MIESKDFRIELYKPSDLDEIMEIENVSFTLPWSRQSYEELAPLDSISIRTAKIKGELVGYMLFQHTVDEVELHVLAVKPSHRKCGIATRLIEHMLGEARKMGARHVFLQVRPSNYPALTLYEKFGFKSVAVRKKYYRDNDEDALVMRMVVGNL